MNEDTIKRRWQREDERAVEDAIKSLLETRFGRKYLWHLLGLGGVGHQPFAGDPTQTAFNCGMLDVGQRILADVIDTSPEGYLTMMMENADEQRTRNAELGDFRDSSRNHDDGGDDN